MLICSECGEMVPNLEGDICTMCRFWMSVIETKDVHPIIDGTCYCLAPFVIDNETPQWNGFEGRWFKLIFNDGRVFYTNNLFHNGDVPTKWRAQLPDNCRFEHFFDKSELEPFMKIKTIRRSDVLEKGMQGMQPEEPTPKKYI